MKLDLDKNQKRQSEKEMDNAEKFSFFFHTNIRSLPTRPLNTSLLIGR